MIKWLLRGWRRRRFVGDRERLLDSENPVLAFAGDPRTGTQHVRPGDTNDEAFATLRRGETRLTRVDDGREVPAARFDRLIFVEPWDPPSASVIGSHAGASDTGRRA